MIHAVFDYLQTHNASLLLPGSSGFNDFQSSTAVLINICGQCQTQELERPYVRSQV